jgi:hypothetical protein
MWTSAEGRLPRFLPGPQSSGGDRLLSETDMLTETFPAV